ncbi:uncharacterized protein [Palaemon carinicauda]|uniref:uncharacterized protein n=1 Tax=Palaemon carinicauda TaxID=392227 RepID=UPI0035B65703
MANPSPVYRKCIKGCHTRLPKASIDPNTICVKCRGKTCTFGDWCEECFSLTESEWLAYERYTQRLERDRIRCSSSRSVELPVSNVIDPNPSLVVVDQEPKEPTMKDMLSAIQALGVRVESLAADKNQIMSEINLLKSCRTGDLSSAKSSANVFSVVEGASARSCRSPSLRPLSSSRTHGRSYVERRKGTRGVINRAYVPSSVPAVVSQVAHPHHRKGEVSALSPSSDDVSRDEVWRQASRPLKRKAQAVEQRHDSPPQQPGCNHWDTPERFQSLGECSPAKRSDVGSEMDKGLVQSDSELIPGSGVTVHAPPLPSDWCLSPESGERFGSDEEGEFALEEAARVSPKGDPKWSMLLGMKQQLSSLMQSYRPAVGSAVGCQSSVLDPLSPRRPVVSGTDSLSHRQSPSRSVQRQVEVDASRQGSAS